MRHLESGINADERVIIEQNYQPKKQETGGGAGDINRDPLPRTYPLVIADRQAAK